MSTVPAAGRARPRARSVVMLVRNPCVDDARVLREARALGEAGWAVTVVATAAEGVPREETSATHRTIRVPVEPLHRRVGSRAAARALEEIQGILLLADFAARAASATRRTPAAVYHAHDLNTLFPAWRLARRDGARLVYDSHELNLEAGASALAAPPRKWLLGRYEGALARRADAVVTVSASIAARLAAAYDVVRPTVVLNCPPARPLVRTRRLREQLALGDDDALVVYHGRLAAGRGLRQAVAAMRHVPQATLALVGSGALAGELSRTARAHGVADRVRFVAPVPVDDVVDLVSAADVGLVPLEPTSPNNRLALPNKLFDYLMAGVPVAASDLTELGAVVRTHRVGRVFTALDAASVARAISAVLAERGDSLRRHVHGVALECFTWERQAARLTAVYEALAAPSADRPRGRRSLAEGALTRRA